MIQSFGNKITEDLFHGNPNRRARKLHPHLIRATLRKLDMINAAHRLHDLQSPPGSRLEPLRGDLVGFHSIRVNDPWRIIFRWEAAGPHDVQLVDYH